MTYAIGDQVDDYVLTEQGWVPRLERDPSPFRPGHVVDGAILTGALEWQPLRTAPQAPYQIGDVVEGYVLVPSGDWEPLAGQLRDRSGAVLQAAAVPAATQSWASAADRSTEPAAKARRTAKKAQRTADVGTTQTQMRAQTQTRAQTRSPQPQTTARRQYRVGQVVDGHVLTADRGWVPLQEMQRPAPRPAGKPATKNDALGRALFGAIAVIVLILLRSCG